MKTARLTFIVIGIAAGMTAASLVFAESAPVYDADALQQQFEQAGQPVPDTPPPPPTVGTQASVQDNTFMPVSQATQASVAAEQTAAANRAAAATAAMPPDQRIRRLEQQMNTLQSSDLTSRTDSLQAQVQDLRSQVEQLSHQLTQMQAQQKAMYSDIDKRLSQQPVSAAAPAASDNTETAPADTAAKTSLKSISKTPVAAKTAVASKAVAAAPTPAVVAPAKSDKTLDTASEQKIYQTAYDLIKAKKYDQAATTLQGMLQKYPSGQFASNAHYWLGELYGLMGKNDQALSEFSTVVKSFPGSPRVSDAQLKVGLIYASQSQWSDAKLALKKVTAKYPGTSSARLAMEQLDQIKQAGH